MQGKTNLRMLKQNKSLSQNLTRTNLNTSQESSFCWLQSLGYISLLERRKSLREKQRSSILKILKSLSLKHHSWMIMRILFQINFKLWINNRLLQVYLNIPRNRCSIKVSEAVVGAPRKSWFKMKRLESNGLQLIFSLKTMMQMTNL